MEDAFQRPQTPTGSSAWTQAVGVAIAEGARTFAIDWASAITASIPDGIYGACATATAATTAL